MQMSRYISKIISHKIFNPSPSPPKKKNLFSTESAEINLNANKWLAGSQWIQKYTQMSSYTAKCFNLKFFAALKKMFCYLQKVWKKNWVQLSYQLDQNGYETMQLHHYMTLRNKLSKYRFYNTRLIILQCLLMGPNAELQ